MGTKARNYTELTQKRLFARAGNVCAFPSCKVRFFDENSENNLSNICHIEGAKEDSARFNSNSNDDIRRSYDNLILLCPTHHKETDDITKYSVESLKEMKRKHEERIKEKINVSDVVRNNPSVLADVIKHIASNYSHSNTTAITNKPFLVNDKITHNNVVKYKSVIEENSIYLGKINSIYTEIESQGSSNKEFLLAEIRKRYLFAKEHTLKESADINDIREHADELIDYVKESLWGLWETSKNTDQKLPYEAIDVCLDIVIVDAFMRCKILEEPKS